jgi:hypothetical protein
VIIVASILLPARRDTLRIEAEPSRPMRVLLLRRQFCERHPRLKVRGDECGQKIADGAPYCLKQLLCIRRVVMGGDDLRRYGFFVLDVISEIP